MAQFDVYRLAARGAGGILLVDLQHKLLEGLATRLVAPVYALNERDVPVLRLNPLVEIEGKRYVVALQELSTARVKELGKKVATIEQWRDEIIAAMDFLITGV